MAVKKTAPSKATPAAPKKAAKAKPAPKPEVATPKTTTPAPKAKAKPKAAPKKAAPKAAEAKTAAPKAKAAAKPKVAAVKLSPTQANFLVKIAGSGETGYPTAKPVEIKTIESLLKHKFVKKGAKDKVSGNTHYLISSAGKKHLETMPASSTTTPASGS